MTRNRTDGRTAFLTRRVRKLVGLLDAPRLPSFLPLRHTDRRGGPTEVHSDMYVRVWRSVVAAVQIVLLKFAPTSGSFCRDRVSPILEVGFYQG